MERFRLFREWALESLVRTVRRGRLLYFRGARLASKGSDNVESLYATLADLEGIEGGDGAGAAAAAASAAAAAASATAADGLADDAGLAATAAAGSASAAGTAASDAADSATAAQAAATDAAGSATTAQTAASNAAASATSAGTSATDSAASAAAAAASAAAVASGGGGPGEPGVIYVRSTGNDSTGTGTLAAPVLTFQAGFTAAVANSAHTLDFGPGNFGGCQWNTEIPLFLRGAGPSRTTLETISLILGPEQRAFISSNKSLKIAAIYGAGQQGADGSPGDSGMLTAGGTGAAGGPGKKIDGYGLIVGTLDLSGGTGGTGGPGWATVDPETGATTGAGNGGQGGDGGDGGTARLIDCIVTNSFQAYRGQPGVGGTPGSAIFASPGAVGQNPGAIPTLYAVHCHFQGLGIAEGSINLAGGACTFTDGPSAGTLVSYGFHASADFDFQF